MLGARLRLCIATTQIDSICRTIFIFSYKETLRDHRRRKLNYDHSFCLAKTKSRKMTWALTEIDLIGEGN